MAGTMLGGGMDVQALSGTKEDSARVVENIAEQFADTANDPFNYTSDAVRKKALKRSAGQLLGICRYRGCRNQHSGR